MTRFALLAALLAAACNPAAVDPLPSTNEPEANAVAPPATAKAQTPTREEPEFAMMGQVRCVTRAGWRVRDCTAGVMRAPDGSAVVTVFHPEGRSRDILFDRAGRATGVRTAEADGSDRQLFAARRAGAATLVTLGPERYEIPDSLLRRN